MKGRFAIKVELARRLGSVGCDRRVLAEGCQSRTTEICSELRVTDVWLGFSAIYYPQRSWGKPVVAKANYHQHLIANQALSLT